MQRSIRYMPLITLVGLSIGFLPIAMTQVSAQEWGESFNPYTHQWEDIGPPSADFPNRQSGEDAAETPAGAAQAPAEMPKRAADNTSQSAEGAAEAALEVPKREADDARQSAAEAAAELLQREAKDSTRWLYERPSCPKMHYHKPLPGRDVCSDPLGGDAEISCSPGATLVIDYHPAGSDACRSQLKF